MSKYDELSEAQKTALRSFREYRHLCADFVARFRKGFAEFLECDEQRLRVFPLGEHDKDKDYRLEESLRAENDGFWSFGLSLELLPRKLTDVPFRLRTLDAVFTLKINSDPESIYQYRGEPFDFSPCYQDIFQRIRDFYQQSLDRYLRGKEQRPIGFSLRPTRKP